MSALSNRFAARHAVAVAVAVALVAVSAGAANRPGLDESQAFVDKLADDAVRTWGMEYPDGKARLKAMNALVQKTFAVEFITRAVLGRYWRTLSADERSEFGELFPQFVVRIYLPHIAKYDREHLRVLGSRPRGKRDVIVKTEIRGDANGEWIDTDWRIRSVDGELRVLDIVVAGVSLILVQRHEFESLIRRDGFASLVEQLRLRADSVNEAASARG